MWQATYLLSYRMVSEWRPVFPLGRNVIGWRQSKTTGVARGKKVIVKKSSRANEGILSGDNSVSDMTDTENDSEMENVAKERKSHKMV